MRFHELLHGLATPPKNQCANVQRFGCCGLLAAVSRIAAILPNDLAPTNMNGPNQPFNQNLDAAVRPVKPAIRARRSILTIGTPISSTTYKFMAVALNRSYKVVTET